MSADVDGEVWCSRCPKPSVRVVMTSTGRHVLCEDCAVVLEFKLYSNAWRSKPRVTKGGRR